MIHKEKGKWYGPCKRCGKEILYGEREPSIMRNSLIGEGKKNNNGKYRKYREYRKLICDKCKKPNTQSGYIDHRSILGMSNPNLSLSAEEYTKIYGDKITQQYKEKMDKIRKEKMKFIKETELKKKKKEEKEKIQNKEYIDNYFKKNKKFIDEYWRMSYLKKKLLTISSETTNAKV